MMDTSSRSKGAQLGVIPTLNNKDDCMEMQLVMDTRVFSALTDTGGANR